MPPKLTSAGKRWIIFGVLSLIYILVYFYRVSLAVVAGDISRELSLSPADLGKLSGILFYVYAVAQIPLGPLIDRYGGRKVISGSGILTTIGGVMFALSNGFAMAMVARILIGIGTASVLMATFTIFSYWFTRQEFGKVSGLMVAVGNLGNLIGTVPLALAVGVWGWRNSFIVMAILQGVVTLLVFVMVKDRPSQAAVTENSSDESRSLPGAGVIASWKEIFGKRDFLFLGALSFFWYGCYLAVQALWGGPYLMEILKLSRNDTGQMLMYTSIGFICGSLMVDSVARKVFKSYKKALLAGQCAVFILMSGFLGWGESLSVSMLVLWFFVLGLAVSSGVMIYPIVRNLFSVNIVGTALTSLNFFVLMGAAVTQHLMGIIIEESGKGGGGMTPEGFHAAFLFPIIGLAVTMLLYLFVKEPESGCTS